MEIKMCEIIKEKNFCICSNCGCVWKTRDDFLNDEEIEIIGYQVFFEALRAGVFLFNHSCKGTFGLEVEKFEDLYDGPIFVERTTGLEECPELCLHEDNLEPCPAKCECTFVREIIQVIKNRKLNANAKG